MIIYEKGDLLKSDTNMIAHQVNCKGIMGSGVAKDIAMNFPGVYDQYKTLCKKKKPEKLLGTNLYVFENNYCVCNMFSQDNYGSGKDEVYTDYTHFQSCIHNIYKECMAKNYSVAFPYKIGCIRGGGNWDIIEKILKDYFKNSDIVCKIRKL
jgi:O-acetyl-ADP-ribose deacetylase (regulator of RNase III)